MISRDDCDRINRLILRAGLPDKPPAAMTADDFMSLMAVDKKNVDGLLRLVLLRSVGDAVVTSEVSPENLALTFARFCSSI